MVWGMAVFRARLRAGFRVCLTVAGVTGILDDLARRADEDVLGASAAFDDVAREVRLSQELLAGFMADAARLALSVQFGVDVDVDVDVSSISDRRPSVLWNLGTPPPSPCAPLSVSGGVCLFASASFVASGKLCEVTVAAPPMSCPAVAVVVVSPRFWGVRRRRVLSAAEFRAELLR